MTKTLTITATVVLPGDMLGDAETIMKIKPAAMEFEEALKVALGKDTGPLVWRQDAEPVPQVLPRMRKPRADRGVARTNGPARETVSETADKIVAEMGH